ncbi:hypothetical protein [Streptomyces sp. NPDC001502]|uniref:hypothetical protein n=1 Tax=Streptomyces sp. NPDC001502 TaxID=3364578 RepID=UPI0036C6BE0F
MTVAARFDRAVAAGPARDGEPVARPVQQPCQGTEFRDAAVDGGAQPGRSEGSGSCCGDDPVHRHQPDRPAQRPAGIEAPGPQLQADRDHHRERV